MRHRVPEAEAILDKPVRVLDHGSLTLIDYMGSDKAVEQAARVSFVGSEEEQRTVQETRGLLRYLMRHRHSTPFEMVELKFHVKVPIFVWRQWVRHRTANINEISARYAQLPNDVYVPQEGDIHKQSRSNKQGRSPELVEDPGRERLSFKMEAETAYRNYNGRINNSGMAREIARINLPLSIYTEVIWKMDLHNIFHFLGLRLHSHAQYEIREYAEAMAPMVKAVAPMAYEAFEDYRLGGMFLSRLELEALKYDLPSKIKHDGLSLRERREYAKRVKRLKNG